MPSTYDPTIPQANDFISNSQAQILDNFDQLNVQFGVDHVPFNTGTGNGTGLHSKVTLPNWPNKLPDVSVDPATLAGSGILYTKPISGISQLFYKDSAGTIEQLSGGGGGVSPTPIGYITLPGGVIMQWGTRGINDPITPPVTGTQVVFPLPFPHAVWSIQVTIQGITNLSDIIGVKAGTVVLTGFNFCKNTSNNYGAYWLAIGN